MGEAAVQGFLLGLSLILAIGAQNAFVLRQGLRREHVLAVVAVCALSDAVLIIAGVAGFGVVSNAVPWLARAMRWAAVAFLVVYGALRFMAALQGGRGVDPQRGCGGAVGAGGDDLPDPDLGQSACLSGHDGADRVDLDPL